jgi:hypothetical protein
LARQLARRRRRERAAGAAIAALGVVVLVVAIFALRHPRGQGTVAGSDTHVPSSAGVTTTAAASRSSTKSAPSSSRARTTSASSTSSAVTTAAKMPLVVLNNTTTVGLAQQASNTFQAGGWSVTQIGNLQNNIVSTCAYYDPAVPGARASAQLLQRQFAAIKRVQPRFPELPSGPIVVVLTPDYASG